MLKDDIMAVKKELKEVSLAREILSDYKKANKTLEKFNKRLFVVWVITFVLFIIAVCWIIYLYRDMGTEIVTEETTTYS